MLATAVGTHRPARRLDDGRDDHDLIAPVAAIAHDGIDRGARVVGFQVDDRDPPCRVQRPAAVVVRAPERLGNLTPVVHETIVAAAADIPNSVDADPLTTEFLGALWRNRSSSSWRAAQRMPHASVSGV